MIVSRALKSYLWVTLFAYTLVGMADGIIGELDLKGPVRILACTPKSAKPWVDQLATRLRAERDRQDVRLLRAFMPQAEVAEWFDFHSAQASSALRQHLFARLEDTTEYSTTVLMELSIRSIFHPDTRTIRSSADVVRLQQLANRLSPLFQAILNQGAEHIVFQFKDEGLIPIESLVHQRLPPQLQTKVTATKIHTEIRSAEEFRATHWMAQLLGKASAKKPSKRLHIDVHQDMPKDSNSSKTIELTTPSILVAPGKGRQLSRPK